MLNKISVAGSKRVQLSIYNSRPIIESIQGPYKSNHHHIEIGKHENHHRAQKVFNFQIIWAASLAAPLRTRNQNNCTIYMLNRTQKFMLRTTLSRGPVIEGDWKIRQLMFKIIRKTSPDARAARLKESWTNLWRQWYANKIWRHWLRGWRREWENLPLNL